MATLGYMGPYVKQTTLAPGDAEWVDFDPSQGFGNCALAVTASALAGSGGEMHVLKVDNVNVTAVEVPGGDPLLRYHAGCNVTNNGKTTITEWSVLVGVITP